MHDYSPLFHAVIAVAMQCAFGISVGEWAAGGMIGCMWFIAREHTQAEYRWIAQFGGGKRANMPWWGGFDPRAWDTASLVDWLVPVISCTVIYITVA